jgi:lincosamide nucleotidyltransferase A/C/D/E
MGEEGRMKSPTEQMDAPSVIQILNLFQSNGIEVVVDGGWAVDTLLEKQTRPHEDLDIAIRHRDVPELRKLLESIGYTDVPSADRRECNFVMGDARGRRVDIHSYEFDEAGHNIFGVAYLPEHLTGRGTILGRPVQCIPVEWMIKFHDGYELDRTDYLDVKALCERFGLDLPVRFAHFEEG